MRGVLFRLGIAGAAAAALLAATTVSGPVTFSSGLTVSGAGTVTVDNTALPPGPNLLVNPWMALDQVNEGAAYSLANSGGANTTAYTLDGWRFFYRTNAASLTMQRVTDAPNGAPNSVKLTVGTGATALANEQDQIFQLIEANFVSGAAAGTAAAKSLTLTAWFKSSVTANQAVTLTNGAQNWFYPTTTCALVANTWTSCSWTIPGDTAGSWTLSGTGAGMALYVWTGCAGTTASSVWGSSFCPAGQTNYHATSGATFQVGPIKLEISPVATPMVKRDPAAEIALAQRYYRKTYNDGAAPGTSSFPGALILGILTGSFAYQSHNYPTMRATPTVTAYSLQTGAAGKGYDIQNSADVSVTIVNQGQRGLSWYAQPSTGTTVYIGTQLALDARL